MRGQVLLHDSKAKDEDSNDATYQYGKRTGEEDVTGEPLYSDESFVAVPFACVGKNFAMHIPPYL